MGTTPSEASKCSVCHRPIHDAASLAIGMGPLCALRAGLTRGEVGSAARLPKIARGLRLLPRSIEMFLAIGGPRTNVTLVADDFGTEFGWGMKASQDARLALALNILLNYLGRDDAFSLAANFAAQHLTRVDSYSLTIPRKAVILWIKETNP